MSEGSDNGLWLPASALSRQRVVEGPPGSLVLVAPARRFAAPSLGLRFDVNDFRFLLALTAFHEGRSPAGCAIDITSAETTGYRVTFPFAIEADLTAPVRRYDDDEAQLGALVAGAEGPGIVALFRPPDSFHRRDAVSVTNWGLLSGEKLEVEFSAWRLVVTLPDRRPVIYRPFGPSAAGASASPA